MEDGTHQVVFGFGYINIICAKFLFIDLQRPPIVQLHLVETAHANTESIMKWHEVTVYEICPTVS